MKTPQPVYLKDYQPPEFYIDTVDLKFELDEDKTIVKANIAFNANKQHKANDLKLIGDGLKLLSVALNGKTLSSSDYRATPDALIIFNVPEKFSLTIETEIKPQENTALSGLYKSSGNFCTQNEAEGFRRIIYFLDRPDVMARYTTTIIADEKKYPIMLSNGNLIESGKLEGGKHWVRWQDPFRKPSYLFALVAGDLEFIEDEFITRSKKPVKLKIFVEKGNKDKCAHAMQAVKKAMRWDEEKFGREYDLDIYMIVAVSDFNMGAMENKGLNIFNTKYILAKPETATDQDYINIEAVIAHEYFHNWTGNRITCRDWFQLSLKEGLTIFRDQSFTADTTSQTVARIQDVNQLRAAQFPEDAGPLAHPVRPDCYIEINNFYTTTVYEKGSEVIRMIQTILGEELFRKGMDLYFERHDGQAVTIEDFVKAMEDASKIDLTQFRLWYSQAGTPVLTVHDHYHASDKKYQLTIQQYCPPTPNQVDKKAMHIPVKMGLIDQQGHELAHQLLHLKNVEQDFYFDAIASSPVPSLLRGFSAPVKLKYNYTDESLQLLFKHDTDLFNRWEAGQTYAVNIILRLVKDFQQKKTLTLDGKFLQTWKHVLEHPHQDNLFFAELLSLPSEIYLSEQMQVVDVEGIHHAREFLLKNIALQLKDMFLKQYQNNHNPSYQFNMMEAGKRQIKNLSLFYLSQLQDRDINEKIIMKQFKQSLTNNMTDTMGALRCLVNDPALRESALSEFFNQWRSDALVVDKWFALQATSKLPGTLQKVKELMSHEAFDIKNPNKVYSLIGAFGHHNRVHFHQADGSGYRFLADCVIQLNSLNPQIAARMVKPLTEWKRFDERRQHLMREQLNLIATQKNISRDVYELVTKSLETKEPA